MARNPPPKHSQFKKGQSGNPQGGRAHNPAIRALKKLTDKVFREVIELIHTDNVAAIKKLAENPNTPAIQAGVAVAFLKAIKSGDYHVIRAVAAEIIGKVPDIVQVQQQGNLEINATITKIDPASLKAAMDKLQEDV